jgi:Ca2+/Na+ antiporter
MFESSNILKSANIGKLLIWFFWVVIGIYLFEFLLSILQVTHLSPEKQLSIFDNYLSRPILVLSLCQMVLFLVWLYRLHQDLNNVFEYYPISPTAAAVRYLVPFYNIWGVWNTLSTFANHFIRDSGNLPQLAKKVRSLIPCLYIAIALSIGLGFWEYNLENAGEKLVNLPVFTSFCDLAVAVIDLLLVQTMVQAISQKVKRVIAPQAPILRAEDL